MRRVWLEQRWMLIASGAWLGGMTTLYVGGYWLIYGQLPPWN